MQYNSNDVRNIAFEQIDDRFSKGKYLGIEVTIDMTNGYINGPHLVGQVMTKGGISKRMDNWRQTKEAKEIIAFISQNEGINVCDLIKDVTNVKNGFRGAYIHQLLVPHVAAWASPRLAHVVGRIMNAIVCGTYTTGMKLYTDPRIEPKIGCIYFIRDEKHVKIGYTYDLPQRLSSLQCANSVELTILGSILCSDPILLEQTIHKEFAEYHIRGEWFAITPKQCAAAISKYR